MIQLCQICYRCVKCDIKGCLVGEVIKRKFGAGIDEALKREKISTKELETTFGISRMQLSRIKNQKVDPGVITALHLVRPARLRIEDCFNLDSSSRSILLNGTRLLFIQPNYIENQNLQDWVKTENGKDRLKGLYAPDRTQARLDIFLSFRTQIAKGEKELVEAGKLKHFEYYLPSNVSPLMDIPESLAVGEAINILRKRRGLSTQQLAELAYVSPSLVNKLENDVSEVSISSFDAIAQVFDLTADELIYLAHPPHFFNPLLIPADTYQNNEIFKNVLVANERFAEIEELNDRVDIMLGFKQWLKLEAQAKLSATEVQLPDTLSLFKLKLAW